MSGNGKAKKIEQEGISNGKPHDYRCQNCGRLLFRAILPHGSHIEIRCWHSECRRMNVVSVPVVVVVPVMEVVTVQAGEVVGV